jgi:nicotinate-nucleotide pyrophosphorylase (carboxylating)
MAAREFPLPLTETIRDNVRVAIAEDVGRGDLTASLVDSGHLCSARVIARQPAVVCGRAWFDACFAALDQGIRVEWNVADGERVAADTVLCRITGHARGILTGERSALNFLQLLSGVATRTADFVDLVVGTRAQIVDTRKTLPGLRLAQKYAVWCGGGSNHRMGLYDAILIKENHIATAGGIAAALERARAVAIGSGGACHFVQIEVESLDQLEIALANGARMVLLDNFSLADLAAAVARTAGRAVLEASGGVNRDTLRAIAETGVDRISIGTITKDIEALDLSMRIDN